MIHCASLSRACPIRSLRRTATVRYRGPEEFPDWHPGRHAPMFAQYFIDCGFPMTCRVLTFFGAPVFTFHVEGHASIFDGSAAIFQIT